MEKKKTWIEAHESEQWGKGAPDVIFPKCKSCIYAADDFYFRGRLEEEGYNLAMVQ